MHNRFWWGNTMERGNFADLGVDWSINVKMGLETGQMVADWINLAQDRGRWWGSVNMDSWSLMMRLIRFPGRSLRNYHYTLRNITWEHWSHILRGGRLKLQMFTNLRFPFHTGDFCISRETISLSSQRWYEYVWNANKLLSVINDSETITITYVTNYHPYTFWTGNE